MTNPKRTPTKIAEPDEAVAPDAAAEGVAPDAAAYTNPFAGMIGSKRWLIAVHGEMVNLHTSERFNGYPKKARVDEFIASQLEAGKMALHIDDEE